MRNFKKLVALVLAFAMVLSMSTVTFAAEMTAAEKAELLGVLKGDGSGVTAEYLAKTPTRIQAAIVSLRLQGLEDEAIAYEGTVTFTDGDQVAWADGQAILAYLKANPSAGWIGYEDGSFKPYMEITAQEFVKVMLESLGYTQGIDFMWADVFTFAASKGLTDLTASSVMTNNSLAVGMLDALAAMTKDGMKLVDKLVAAGKISEAAAIVVGLVEEDMDFAIKSVEPFGLKAIKITFTSDIDDDEDYEVVIDDEDGDVEAYVIDDNVMIVVLEDDGDDLYASQAQEIELEISAVGTDSIEVDEEYAEVTMVDKEDPELVSVTVENAKTFVVKYSEPIDPDSYENGTAVFDDVLLDDAKLVGEVEASDDYTELTYTLNSAKAANTYDFTMEEVADFAGFIAPSEVVTVTVVGDSTEPQIVEVDVTSTDEIVLIFDEDVEDIGDITVAGNDIDSSDVSIEDEEVTVELDSPLSASDAFISVKVTWEDVEDVIGNKGDGETTFTAPFDDDAPTVMVEVSSDNELVFIFSEEVEGFETGSLSDIFMIEDDDGDEISVGDFFDGTIETDETDIDDYEDEDDEDHIYYILLDSDYVDVDETDITITIDGTDDDSLVTDLSVLANELQEVEFDITLNDLLDPEIEDDVLVVDGDWAGEEDDETFRMVFSEEMDEDTLEDVGNYILDDEPLKNYDYEITVANDNMSVDILVEETSLAGLVIEFYGLEDEAGNTLTGDETIGALVDDFDGVTFTLTALDTIEVEYAGGSFVVADPDEFKLVDENDDELDTIYVTNAVVGDGDDDDMITLTLSDDLTAYGEFDEITTDGSLKIYIRVEGDDTVNTFDIPLVQAKTDVTDEVSATAEMDIDDDTITVEFDEIVYATDASVVASLLIYNEDEDQYEDAVITYYDVNDDVVADPTTGFTYFTFDLTADDEYTIELISRYIEDDAGNVAGGVDEDTYNPE